MVWEQASGWGRCDPWPEIGVYIEPTTVDGRNPAPVDR